MEKSESFALRCFHSVSCPAIFGVLPLAHSSLEEIGSGAAAAAREANTAAFTTLAPRGRPGPARQGRNSETQHRSVDGPLPQGGAARLPGLSQTPPVTRNPAAPSAAKRAPFVPMPYKLSPQGPLPRLQLNAREPGDWDVQICGKTFIDDRKA